MDTVEKWKNLVFDTLGSILKDIAAALPGIFGAFVVILFGWITIKVVSYILKKVMRIVKVDELSKKIDDAKLFGDSNFKIDISKIILSFVKGILWLVFIIVAADVMNLKIISNEIANLLRYIPKLLTALIIFMVGLYLAKTVKKTIITVFDSMDIRGGKALGNVLFYLIVIFVGITSLNQAGINTEIITSNFTIILGSFLLAFALALGLGSREIVGDLLRTFYSRKIYEVGDKIKVKDMEGTIEAIDNISVVLKTKKGKVVLPIKKMVNNTVEVDV
ncbi:mechanosensitive ion channel [Maribacter sp. MMG018]|uniref:mechanosensitive ion channel family protein n=1 Tax=Maribacter sp. MMG018 TaxID=2822688 RepID=UPI001B37A3AD|nr:mechanosensitive ion channel domain-containing protein [Maribacter sp. MMG018]MBQ4916142.1 mechanosensitive ion channel [Maribacter sp. MMG018]